MSDLRERLGPQATKKKFHRDSGEREDVDYVVPYTWACMLEYSRDMWKRIALERSAELDELKQSKSHVD